MPTNHGFDEFFGYLYHLNAEEEPENLDYPSDMVMPDGQTFHQRFGPRGVIHSCKTASFSLDKVMDELTPSGG